MRLEISSQVVNGLFTVTGVGLIPWRVTDAFRKSRWQLEGSIADIWQGCTRYGD